jgi:multidrug resistance efflux pump
VANQHKKDEIIAEAEALDLSDPKAAQSTLRALQSRYDEVGHVPRESMHRTDDRMRAAEQRVRAAVDAEWERSSITSNPFLAELRARLTEAEAKLERARHAGDAARIAKAEAEVAQRRSLIPE